MRKSCDRCLFSKNITYSDRMNGYAVNGVTVIESRDIPDDESKCICVMKNDIHRKHKEQRNCTLFDEK